MTATGQLGGQRRCLSPGRAGAVFLFGAVAISAACGCAQFRHRQKVVPDSVAACRKLSCDAVAAMERGQTDEARRLLTKAVEASPGDIDARRQLAEILWQAGERQQAAAHMQVAVKLDPRHAPTVVRCGEMMLELNSPERSLAFAEEAIVLDPTLAGGWALRGRVFRQRGDSERALADLQQALRYSPNAPDLLQETAELQFKLGRPQRCLATVQHLLETTPAAEQKRESLWLAGVAYGAVDRRDEAVTSLAAASQRGAPSPELLYQLAQAQRAAGRPQDAAATARLALATDSGHQPSRALLAQLEAAGVPGVDAPIRR
jgi:tetratricopeptide (TPR) repeat protein